MYIYSLYIGIYVCFIVLQSSLGNAILKISETSRENLEDVLSL